MRLFGEESPDFLLDDLFGHFGQDLPNHLFDGLFHLGANGVVIGRARVVSGLFVPRRGWRRWRKWVEWLDWLTR